MAELYFRETKETLHWTTVFPGDIHGKGGKFVPIDERPWKNIVVLDDQANPGNAYSSISRSTRLVSERYPHAAVFNSGNIGKLL